MIYLSPIPLTSVKQNSYKHTGYDPFLSILENPSLFDRVYKIARYFTLSWKKKLVQKLVKPGARLLDCGCGTGEFLAALKNDYEVQGIEPVEQVARWAVDNHKIMVHNGNLKTVILENPDFQLVSLWHVLEHIPDPLSDLKIIHNLLSEEGLLLIALPNIAALDARIYKSSWVALDAPRHLWHFTGRNITEFARKAGFVLQTTGMLPLDPVYNVLLSEQLHQEIKGSSNKLLSSIRVPIITLISIFYGLITGNHSSKYYVFRKT